MINDTRAKVHLWHLTEDLRRSRELLRRELQYRRAIRSSCPHVMALDFDVIYQHLHPNQVLDDNAAIERAQDCLSLISALQEQARVLYTVPPGSLCDMVNHLSWLSHTFSRHNDPAALLHHLTEYESLQEPKLLHRHLLRLCTLANHSARAVRTVRDILRHENYIHLDDEPWSTPLATDDSGAFDACFRYLQTQRRHARCLANENDSNNLAILIKALRAGFPVTLATISTYVPKAYETAWTALTGTTDSPPAVLPPRLALFRIALSRGTRDQLMALESSLARIAKQTWLLEGRSYETSRVLDDLSLQRLGDIQKQLSILFDQFSIIQGILPRVWSPPRALLPEEIDLDVMARHLVHLAAVLREEILDFLDSCRDLYRRALGLLDPVTPRITDAIGPKAVLTAAANDKPSSLYASTLIYIAQGGKMEDRSIHQHAGRDVNAVIESYKHNTINAGRSPSPEVEQQLRVFLEAVAHSALPEADKETVTEGTATVSRDVAKSDGLAGPAKLLWNGIKDVIRTVPKAVAAWEALGRLWQ